MNFTEKYDQLISLIEDAVKANEEEIAEKLAKVLGTNTRHLAEAFQFISGVTLSQYIKQRRLINTVKYKFDSNCSLETAAIKFGFPDAATMSKAFKACFGISPSQISKDTVDDYKPLALALLSSNQSKLRVPKGIEEEMKNLADDYGMNENEALFAYELSQKHNVSLYRAFELVDNFANMESLPMDDKELFGIIDQLSAYLESEKVFIKDPVRIDNVRRAMEILIELYPGVDKEIKDDPLQMGAVILCVEDSEIGARGENELLLFAELCSLVDNFSIYPTSEGKVHFGAVIQGVYKRIG